MNNKILVFVLVLMISGISYSHEGDEEVLVKNKPRYGGRVAKVVMEEDHKYLAKPLPGDHKEESKTKSTEEHERHNEAKYMSEMLISDENIIRLYFYNTEMKDIDLKDFPEEVFVDVRFPGLQSRGPRIALKKKGKEYYGVLPRIKKKPYNFFVDFNLQNLSLHISFVNVD